MKTKPQSSKAPPSLPTLSLPHNGETVIAVTVLENPIAKGRGELEWVVNEPPSRRLGHGQLISIKNTSRESGPGLLTSVTDLSRHWVTWAVSGGPAQYRLRVPVPWAAMTGVEAIAHDNHFRSLPDRPPPHQLTMHIPNILATDASPYDLALSPGDLANLETRLNGITQRRWEWRPENERKRRRRRDRPEAMRSEAETARPADHAGEELSAEKGN
ncbi:hypothetical protein FOMPIDRAFT_1054321 [Fomitopsis schrenkii]|uniref:Uncharacterized protein n=1 Tax=Fomitopsis schrenkii TaxID=2126942 RepID=S8DPN2_FOMSC|nr:hypothetical protein FOMPIDRAFT_1054321 [Fomitopsis schrenkii]